MDNVDDDASFAEALLRKLHRGRVIITGRTRNWPDYVVDLHLNVLQLEHATEYLMDATEGKRTADPVGAGADKAQAAAIAKELDGLALALAALVHFEETLRILNELHTLEPDNLAHQREPGIALNNVGRIREDKDQQNTALSLFERSRTISDRITVRRSPATPLSGCLRSS